MTVCVHSVHGKSIQSISLKECAPQHTYIMILHRNIAGQLSDLFKSKLCKNWFHLPTVIIAWRMMASPVTLVPRCVTSQHTTSKAIPIRLSDLSVKSNCNNEGQLQCPKKEKNRETPQPLTGTTVHSSVAF